MVAKKKESKRGEKEFKREKKTLHKSSGQKGAGAVRRSWDGEGKSESREGESLGKERKGKGRGREGSQQRGVRGEALGMLPFPQERTEHPCTAPSRSFLPVLPAEGYFAAAVDVRGFCSRAPAEHGAAERGGKEGNSTGSSNILLLPVCTKYVNTWHPLCYLFRAKVPT